MQISDIIAEADVLVENTFSDAQKVVWLNEINNEFFDVVKIPKVYSFNTTANTSDYSVATDIRAKNIDKVQVGRIRHLNWLYENVPPGQNFFLLNEDDNEIMLDPAPTSVQPALIRYYRIATTTFTSSGLTAEPDAPEEYHYLYIPALAAKIAKAMEDVVKANNYEQDYRGGLAIAQQNYKNN